MSAVCTSTLLLYVYGADAENTSWIGMILTGTRDKTINSSRSVYCPFVTQINRLVLCNVCNSTVLLLLGTT